MRLPLDDRAPGAYVHVPYCAHRCSYCSFTAFAGLEGEEGYFEALLGEIRARAAEVVGPFGTVYFGGGTPSYVPPSRLGSVLRELRAGAGIADGAEITAEANPDDLTDARLAELADLGVNRLSIGVQSLSDAELVPLERRHDAAAALSAVARAARRFPGVSADLMIGIPGQTRETLAASALALVDAGVTHLSAYLLELEKAPRLVQLRAANPELFADDEEAAERWEMLDELLLAAGLPRYEMSNWARPGHESRHNVKYWLRRPVLGFGVSAHSFDGRVRRANSGSAVEYVRRIREGERPVVSEERLESGAAAREEALLALRLAAGVPEAAFSAAAATLPAEDRERLADREAAGLLERADGKIRLTRRGVLLSNEVFSLLL